MDKKKEQFAVYERVPAHGKDKDGVILAPYNTKEEAETAKKRYGYDNDNDNYYVDVLRANCFITVASIFSCDFEKQKFN